MSSRAKRIAKARDLAIAKQGNFCCWCGEEMLPANGRPKGLPRPVWNKLRATAEHLIERRHGGTDAQENIAAAHAMCNEGRDRVSADAPSWTHEEYLEAREDLLRAVGR